MLWAVAPFWVFTVVLWLSVCVLIILSLFLLVSNYVLRVLLLSLIFLTHSPFIFHCISIVFRKSRWTPQSVFWKFCAVPGSSLYLIVERPLLLHASFSFCWNTPGEAASSNNAKLIIVAILVWFCVPICGYSSLLAKLMASLIKSISLLFDSFDSSLFSLSSVALSLSMSFYRAWSMV